MTGHVGFASGGENLIQGLLAIGEEDPAKAHQTQDASLRGRRQVTVLVEFLKGIQLWQPIIEAASVSVYAAGAGPGCPLVSTVSVSLNVGATCG